MQSQAGDDSSDDVSSDDVLPFFQSPKSDQRYELQREKDKDKIPLFSNPHFIPRNVKRREVRTARKIEMQKQKIQAKDIIIRKLQKEVRKNVKTIEHLNESFSSAKVKIASITESHDQISARSFELKKEIKSLKKKQLKLEKNEDLVEADFMKSEFLIDTMKNELLVREQEIKHLQVDNPNLSKAIQILAKQSKKKVSLIS